MPSSLTFCEQTRIKLTENKLPSNSFRFFSTIFEIRLNHNLNMPWSRSRQSMDRLILIQVGRNCDPQSDACVFRIWFKRRRGDHRLVATEKQLKRRKKRNDTHTQTDKLMDTCPPVPAYTHSLTHSTYKHQLIVSSHKHIVCVCDEAWCKLQKMPKES